ncbi:DUF1990 family protein [Rubrivirga sp. S365]|uniref:DUF1990 family protein n=1 Tax=Rubrivirga sp. S365 TaxID=3076080 RepID=UPI0028C7F0A4|nr:DUF1990 family protein [Rubrivirga sp. S365]MDT7857927.1 DUF1990 family protein [Rubrivirga sp. S365]
MRRLGPVFLTSAAAVGGAALAVAVWRRWAIPVREEVRDVARAPAAPDVPDVEPEGHRRILHEEDGEGPRFHRRYEVDVEATTKTPEELVACIGADIQDYVPDEIAVFDKTVGEPGRLAVGDEFDIEIRSPWNGPVRVVEAEPTRFTLATLEGHMEAGLIRFEAADHPARPGALRFAIESWARSADGVVDLAYDGLGVAKAGQTAMWTFFCERVAEDCGGRRAGEVRVTTEREETDPETPAAPPRPARDGSESGGLVARYVPGRPDWTRYADRLDAIRAGRLNFEADHEVTEAAGWHLDTYDVDLVPEPPGPPLPAGDAGASWAVACRLVRDYAFPDPKLITGIFSPDDPLPGRPMLLRARFLFFTFWFGVRVGDEVDEVREATDAGVGRVWAWGYDYATLEGHFERGRITFEVRKEEATGRVRFHIDAFSKPDRIRNPFYRIGFKLFGRRLQLQFARSACERMQRFVREELAARAAGGAAPPRETVEPAAPPDDVPVPDAAPPG